MALSLKNPETERLAKELARKTGESVTRAVTIALKERLERQKPNPKEGLAAWLDELTKRTAPLLKDLPSSDKVGDLLFDKETGLPL
ncbi:MAG TPA: type II toxin-antitoxin system VapB family antitoxin [Terracidiphilus sp.]|nr:type II toxin-antitoxin system VapB family antitoxin [Terracidiphilus sp.]